jgi:hypothetical protein
MGPCSPLSKYPTHRLRRFLGIISMDPNVFSWPHPDKILIAAIIHQIYLTPHLVHIHKVRAHTGIKGNEIADTLANEGTNKEKPTPTPHIHIAHVTPYWLTSCPTATRDGAIRNLHSFITKAHDQQELRMAQHKHLYVDKWLSNDQINQKFTNHF